DIGFILLGFIIEEIYGKSLDQVYREKIADPLGLKNTYFNPPRELRERIAATEYCKYRKKIVWGEVHDENAWSLGGVAGHAGAFSTALDLAIYAQTLLNKGTYNGTKIFSPRAVEEMTSEQLTDGEDRRALGWTMRIRGKYSSGGDLLSLKAFGHTGFTGTSLWIDPELKLIVVFLTNRVHYGRENRQIIKDRPILHNMIVGFLSEG
ncbi:MAG TPA: hypothetical protein ENF87_00185, partial [Thermoproteales archaeon]|nr:hypothetical protein [Thermoproteales archaeon]